MTRTIVVVVGLLLLGGVLPTGSFGVAHLPNAILLCATALIPLFVSCMVSGFMTTRAIRTIESVPATAVITSKPAARKATVLNAVNGEPNTPHPAEIRRREFAGKS